MSARSRAIALLDEMLGHAYLQSCTAFVDAVLSAAEGRTQKTSGGSPGVNDPAGTIAPRDTGASTAVTGAAAGPEDCGTDFGVTYRIEGHRIVLFCPCGRETVRSWFGDWQHWSCDDCGAIHLRPKTAPKDAAPASSDGRPDREALGRAAYEAKCFAEGNAAIPYGWKPAELGQVWEQWCVVGERLYEMGRKDGEARAEAAERVWIEDLKTKQAAIARADSASRECDEWHERFQNMDRMRVDAERDRDAAVARAEAAEGHLRVHEDALNEATDVLDDVKDEIDFSESRPNRELRSAVRAVVARSEAAEHERDGARLVLKVIRETIGCAEHVDLGDAVEAIHKRMAVAETDAGLWRGTAESAEARVRELESDRPESAWLIEMVRPVTNLYWTGDAFGTVDCAIRFARKLDAERVLETSVNQRDRCAVTGHSWMSLRPTAPTAGDGDEKEKTNG